MKRKIFVFFFTVILTVSCKDKDDKSSPQGGVDTSFPEDELPFSSEPVPPLSGHMMAVFSFFGSGDFGDLFLVDFNTIEQEPFLTPVAYWSGTGVAHNGKYFVYYDYYSHESVVSDFDGVVYARSPGGAITGGIYAWTSDDGFVYYSDSFTIWEIDVTNNLYREVAFAGPQTLVHAVAISPDDKILIHSNNSFSSIEDMYRTELASLRREHIWRGGTSERHEDLMPEFLDNKHILFKASLGGRGGIHRLNVYTKEITRVVEHEKIVAFSLSPNKTKLVFHDGKRIFLVQIPSWKKKLVDITNEKIYQGILLPPKLLAWSPNSRYFAIMQKNGITQFNEVHLYSSDGDKKWFLAKIDSGNLDVFVWGN